MTTVEINVEGEGEAVDNEAPLSPVDEAAAVITVATAAVELSEQTRASADILAAEREAQNIRDNEAWKTETLSLFNSRMEEVEQRTLSALTAIQSSMEERLLSIQPITVIAEEPTVETVEPQAEVENSHASTETEASERDAAQTRTHEGQHRKHRWT